MRISSRRVHRPLQAEASGVDDEAIALVLHRRTNSPTPAGDQQRSEKQVRLDLVHDLVGGQPRSPSLVLPSRFIGRSLIAWLTQGEAEVSVSRMRLSTLSPVRRTGRAICPLLLMAMPNELFVSSTFAPRSLALVIRIRAVTRVSHPPSDRAPAQTRCCTVAGPQV